MTSAQHSFRYRYDLDGLRGVAIALVVIYHVFVGRVSGGVDVFLLLSGYFFLGSQLRYISKPGASYNPWWPFWRMIRRLAPALITSVGVSMALLAWLTPQLMRTELVKQVTASLLYFQNAELSWQAADYAAAASDTSPLQHLWSMSVQGQFYLLAIFFSLGTGLLVRFLHWRGSLKRSSLWTTYDIAGPALIIITAASFMYASRFGFFAPASNYYDFFARLWELTLGGCLAVYGHKIKIPARIASIISWVGLAAIALTGVVIANTQAYPGPLTLLPLGGALAIIVGGGGKLSGYLASKQARWLGNIAYPLYLWHWPLLIIFTAYARETTPSWWLGILIIAVSVVLAQLTHRFIEAPLRQVEKRPTSHDMPVNRALLSLRTTPGRLRGAGGTALAALCAALLALQPMWHHVVDAGAELNLNAADYPGAMALHGKNTPTGVKVQPDPIVVRGIATPVISSYCFVAKEADADHYNTESIDGQPCIFGDPTAPFDVYLVGGSHAEQWSSALDKLGKQMGFRVIPLLRQDCPIELGDDVTVTPKCAQWAQGAVEKLVEDGADLVISSSTRPSNADGHGPDSVPAGYVAFWEKLAKENIPFLGLRDNPWGFDPEGLGREYDQCFVATGDAVACGMKREEVYADEDPAAAILSKFKNMISVDTSDWFCDATNCPVVIGNVFVYRDMHHISAAYADSTMPLLREYIKPFLEGKPVQQQPAASSSSRSSTSPSASQARTTTPAPATPRPTTDPVPYPLWWQNDAPV